MAAGRHLEYLCPRNRCRSWQVQAHYGLSYEGLCQISALQNHFQTKPLTRALTALCWATTIYHNIFDVTWNVNSRAAAVHDDYIIYLFIYLFIYLLTCFRNAVPPLTQQLPRIRFSDDVITGDVIQQSVQVIFPAVQFWFEVVIFLINDAVPILGILLWIRSNRCGRKSSQTYHHQHQQPNPGPFHLAVCLVQIGMHSILLIKFDSSTSRSFSKIFFADRFNL